MDFCVLTMYKVLNLLIAYRAHMETSRGFLFGPSNRDNFISFVPICVPLFFLPYCRGWAPQQSAGRSGESKYPCLHPDLPGKATVSPLNLVTLVVGF